MASTQKVILTILFAQLLMTTVINLYNGDVGAAINYYNARNANIEERSAVARSCVQTLNGEDCEQAWYQKAWSKASNIFSELVDGVILLWQLVWIFVESLFPLGISSSMTTSTIETIIVIGFETFKYIFWTLVILEGYILFKNRKASS